MLKDVFCKQFRKQITQLFLVGAIGLVPISAFAQVYQITMKKSNAPLSSVIAEIEKESGYTFFYNDDQINLEHQNYLIIGTLESYLKIRDYFGKEKVVPIYIEVEDGERLSRALNRERMQESPKYEELCRRFLADAKDFSGEKLKEAGITRRFVNQDLDETEEEIRRVILENR